MGKDREAERINDAFDNIVANVRGLSHLERIVGIVHFEDDKSSADAAVKVYAIERGSTDDIYFPSINSCLSSHENVHLFIADFLENNPDARVFVGIDSDEYVTNRGLFEHLIVGKTRLVSDMSLPSLDGTIIFVDEMGDGYEEEVESASVWEQHGINIKQNMIIVDPDVGPEALSRMVLDGTDPMLRVLIASHPAAGTGALLGILEEADPAEEHLFKIISERTDDPAVQEKIGILSDEC